MQLVCIAGYCLNVSSKTAVISVVIILNIKLNVIVIAVIVKHPQLREDRTTLFMLSLTISDLANGCTAIPISAAVCSDATPNARNMTRYLPKIMVACDMFCPTMVNPSNSLSP